MISTLWAFSPIQVKQMRHFLLILMLYCPFRSPLSCSSLLDGGQRRSCIEYDLCTILSLRSAGLCKEGGNLLDVFLWNRCSVSLSLKLMIINIVTGSVNNVKCYWSE